MEGGAHLQDDYPRPEPLKSGDLQAEYCGGANDVGIVGLHRFSGERAQRRRRIRGRLKDGPVGDSVVQARLVSVAQLFRANC